MPPLYVSPQELAKRSPFAAEMTTRRINLGMSQQNLADAVHCHVYTIGELEKDRIKVSVGLIERIKAALAWTD